MAIKKMRTAIIGCGYISGNYLLSARLVPSMEVVKLMDVKGAVARQRGEQFGIPHTDDLQEVLGDPSIETVIVSVPHFLHQPLAIKAARAGKHILLDKPIATTLADGRSIIAACKKHGVRLGINFPRRGYAVTHLARDLVRRGAIGEITYVKISEYIDKDSRYWTTGHHGLVKTDWRSSKTKSGGGCILMNISHNLDEILFITGLPVARVAGFAATLDTPVEVEDAGCAALQFSNGALGSIAVASIMRGKHGAFFEPTRIVGKQGQIILANPLRVYTTRKIKGLRPHAWNEVPFTEKYQVKTPGYHGPHYGGMLDGCVQAIRHNRPMPTTGEEALQTLAVVLGLYQSSRTGKAVRLGKH